MIQRDVFGEIHAFVNSSPVALYMKGNQSSPACGFSSTVVSILKHLRVPFVDFDVMKDESIRQGIKDYSRWPTIPQLYVNGIFVGGCDIVLEMYQDNSLSDLLHNITQ